MFGLQAFCTHRAFDVLKLFSLYVYWDGLDVALRYLLLTNSLVGDVYYIHLHIGCPGCRKANICSSVDQLDRRNPIAHQYIGRPTSHPRWQRLLRPTLIELCFTMMVMANIKKLKTTSPRTLGSHKPVTTVVHRLRC